MARKLRIEYPGAIYHITLRGNGRQSIFADDHDRKRFLRRLSESAATYNVRLYLYCLMSNHAHLVLETPEGNVSRFMQSFTTGYTVYFNLRHNKSGHLFQGRFGGKLVEGDTYLQALTRYVHLNPVYTRSMKKLPVMDRIKCLRAYRWSSYRGYVGSSKELTFVDYGPVLAQIGGRGKKAAQKRYKEYVEAGVSEPDDEFVALKKAALHAIGGDEFSNWAGELYQKLIEKKDILEDVSFRHMSKPLKVDDVMDLLAEELNVDVESFKVRKHGAPLRAIAGSMLCRYAGLTQRAAAKVLEAGSGAGLSQQIGTLSQRLEKDKKLRSLFESIESRLDEKRILIS